MKIHAKATLDEMLFEWALAESESERFGDIYAGLDAFALSSLRRGDRSLMGHPAWASVREAVRRHRSAFLSGPLLSAEVSWRVVALEPAEFRDLTIIGYPSFLAFCPSRKLGDFVRRLASGEYPSGEERFAESFRKVKASFSPSKLRGKPVLVSRSDTSAGVIVEGYTRLCVMAALDLEKRLTLKEVPVIHGVCPALDEWNLSGKPGYFLGER